MFFVHFNKYVLLALAWLMVSIYWIIRKEGAEISVPFVYFKETIQVGIFFGQTWLMGKIWLNNHLKVNYKIIAITLIIWAIVLVLFDFHLNQTSYGIKIYLLNFFLSLLGIIIGLWMILMREKLKN